MHETQKYIYKVPKAKKGEGYIHTQKKRKKKNSTTTTLVVLATQPINNSNKNNKLKPESILTQSKNM